MLEGMENRTSPSNMAKQEYFLYGGLFLAGAILMPTVAGLTKGGDRPAEETTAEGTMETFETEDSDLNAMAAEPSTATFAPEDDREQILKDYEDNSAAALSQIPAAIPEFAANQPGVPTYPNYWAGIRIPTFSSQPLALPSPGTDPSPASQPPEAVTTAPPNSGPQNSQNLESFRTGPEEMDSTLQNQNRIQTSSGLNLEEFVNSAPARDFKWP
ncbi:hypothetical protein NIES970_13060 [[Synechococcus] sp. NIES-970]|nr:hypothetical protein NIES970_13060 [[Synechococcus] sp. NIES-970]